ncbi:MAG: tRNA (adenosine(37)-N6)-dimethylallyltransferase MiaA [Magnetococcales bacterium]|nr:tRNA (adenosine(37)-N6)-dimethylallyltransferase MiaA [Magnetococcales bacterium]
MNTPSTKILVILGATASGKTRLGVQLARHLDGEILSADSRQVYRGLDIGTGKDLHEYENIPYHMIDIMEPGEEFNLFAFQQRVHALLPQIRQRHHLPILVGGTGLYLDAIINRYRLVPVPPNHTLRDELKTLSDQELAARLLRLKPEQHNVTDLETRNRMIRAIEIAGSNQPPVDHPPLSCLILGMRRERSALRQRIRTRLAERLQKGMLAEVQQLLDAGIPPATLLDLGLEYRFLTRHLLGEMDHETMFQKLHQAICQFAKRQETWFRRMERHGTRIHWLNADQDPFQAALAILARPWPTPA